MKMFKAGNLPQIGSTIFWANLRSLDRAMSIKRNGFKNDPILVSGELVIFLAVNTGIETIEVLETKVKDLQGELGQAKANAAASTKAATLASNKADENKTRLEAFKKRLEKVERA
jgi:tRNA(Phe) wybutosine-synthesizing methylase Tyw3